MNYVVKIVNYERRYLTESSIRFELFTMEKYHGTFYDLMMATFSTYQGKFLLFGLNINENEIIYDEMYYKLNGHYPIPEPKLELTVPLTSAPEKSDRKSRKKAFHNFIDIKYKERKLDKIKNIRK